MVEGSVAQRILDVARSVAHHVIQVAPFPVLTVGPAGQARNPVIRAEAVAENALSVELIRQHLSTSTVGRPLTA